jgi:HAE1 family hydrophobic/amphiphilic exporter-1
MIKFFTNRPLFTASVFSVVLLIGIFSWTNLARDQFPDIKLNSLTVITVYRGASAEDIETVVTKKIEDAVATVSNIEKIESTSSEGVSSVVLTFKYGTNLDSASADVRDKLEQIKSNLPDDAEQPYIFKFDMTMIPVMYLGVSAQQSYKDLYHITDKVIADSLKRIEGVGSVNILGGLVRQINVEIDRARLAAYGLSLNQIIAFIQASNLSIPAGNLQIGSRDYSIRIPGEYGNVAQIEGTIVGNYQGRNIYLKDIARVTDSHQEETSLVLVNGRPGLSVYIQKQSGANTINVVKEIRKELKRLKDRLPSDVVITEIFDGSEMITKSLNNLNETMFWGLVFVMLTVYFFLRNVRGSLIISLVLPVSLVASFIYLYFSGSSINMISLSAIVISIGAVVDNAIVVMENIYRHRDEKKEALHEAAIFGAGEVAQAVAASTFTNLIIFVPIIMVPGFITFFFRQLALTTTVVMLVSLFASLSLTPMVAAKFLKVDGEGKPRSRKSLVAQLNQAIGKFLDVLDDKYKNLLNWALQHRRVVAISSVVLFLTIFVGSFVGRELFPEMDHGSIQVNVEMPTGTRWEETAAVMKKVEKIVEENVAEKRYLMVTAGSSGQSFMSAIRGLRSGPNYGTVLARLVPKKERKRSTAQIEKILEEKILQIPGIKSVTIPQEAGANRVAGVGQPVSVEIYGFDLEKTDAVAEQVKKIIDQIPGVVDTSISRKKGAQEFWVEVNREKVATLGLTVGEIAQALRYYFYGSGISKYREAGDEYDIYLQLRHEDRRSLADLDNIFITNRMGQNIALANIARIEKRNAPLSIERKNQQRVVYVEGNIRGANPGGVNDQIKKAVRKIPLSPDTTIKAGAYSEKMGQYLGQLLFALLVGILLVYLVMVAQFESLLEPFIIMFAVPFALTGVIWTLFLLGIPLGIMSFIGMIMVVGIVVNNAIVLIDYTNIMRARGVALFEAIVRSGRNRLRPILMTTVVTILGLVPMAISTGEGSEMWAGLAWPIIGGLLVSTAFSLIFVPVVYSVVEQRYKKREYFGHVMKL